MGIRAKLDIACRNEEHLKTITLIINSLEDACVFTKEKNDVDTVLKEAEFRINECLKDTNKKKDEGQPEGYPWKSEALGYKTSLECIKRTREKFSILGDSA